ncbi:MAG: tRNA pseudouridine(55) synthase TruB [Oscillospiraceae bacterium]|nr:tRNA pseudouridine(55) synthase TruB [Oscillospiraceae bacterium]
MNGVVIADKPAGWTSHDVVAKLRGVLRVKRVGHGGTLDPMATGVLPVFVGRATRAVEFFESAEKEYIAGLRLGVTTDTQDTSGAILQVRPAAVTRDALTAALRRFTGELDQLPPMYSAVKIGGQPLYKKARQGVEVTRSPRRVTIRELALLGLDGGDYTLRVVCSKGTYVRTLCHDIGEYLGCGGAMSALRRTRAGAFTIADALPLGEILSCAQRGDFSFLRPVDSLFAELPAVKIEGGAVRQCRNGADFGLEAAPDGLLRVYDDTGAFLALGRAENGVVCTVKSFFDV